MAYSKRNSVFGQGTIEYLVIIGVVVVISLVVVGLLTSLTDNQNVSRTAKKIGAYSSAISISDAAMDASGDAVFVVRSNQGNDLTLSSITVNGTAIPNSTQVGQSSTSKVTVSGVANSCCNPGEVGPKDCDVYFTYSTPNLSSIPPLKLTVTVECIEDVVVPSITPILDTTPPIITLTSPIGSYSTMSNSIDFNFRVHDNESTIRDCNLIINNAINGVGKSSPIIQDINLTFSRSLSAGTYFWDINCTDGNSNLGASGENRRLDVIVNPAGFVASCWSDVTNPHPLCNCNDLNLVRTHLDWSYKMQNDINMKVTECAAYRTGAGFAPIGSTGTPFTGYLDGNGKVLTGLYIYQPSSTQLGLFASISTGTIAYMGMRDTNVIGISNVIARWNFGSFSGNGGNILSSYSTNAYIQGSNGAGGINGSGGNIVNCYSSGTIVGADAYVGGITGVSTMVNKSYSTATVYGNNYGNNGEGIAGGIVGEINGGTILNSFATGQILTTHPTISVVGGALGRICNCGGGTNTFTNNAWFDNVGDLASNCYQSGNTSCTKYDSANGGISGFYYDTNVPINSWGTWTNVSGNKWSTTDGNWSICRGAGLPWLSWENRTC